MFGIFKRNNGYGMLLQALMLAAVMSFMAVGAAEAQEKKPRKKLKELSQYQSNLVRGFISDGVRQSTPSFLSAF